MTPADKDAMLSAYVHRGASLLTGDVFAYGFAAGLSHARKQEAAQLEAIAADVAKCCCIQCSNAAAEMREMSATIRGLK